MEKESEPIFEGQHIDDAVKWLKPKLEKHWEEDWGVIQDAFLSWGNRQFVPLLEEELDHAWALVVKNVVPKKKYLVDTQTDEVEITMTSWGEINKLTFPKNRWRISDLLPIEGYVVVAAISGERKSWFALEMMNALTTPRPLLHEDRFETKGCSVLYVDCEMSNSELQRRGKQLGFNEKHTHGMHFITGDNLNLSNPEREDLDVGPPEFGSSFK